MCFTQDNKEKPIVAVLQPKPRDNSNNSNIYLMKMKIHLICR